MQALSITSGHRHVLVVIGGRTYGEPAIIGERLGMPLEKVRTIIKRFRISEMLTNAHGKRSIKLYPLEEISKHANDISLVSITETEPGVIVKRNARYVTPQWMATSWGCQPETAKKRMNSYGIPPIRVRSNAKNKAEATYYELTAAQKVCADLWENIPVLSASGDAVIDGRHYGSRAFYIRQYGCATHTLNNIIDTYAIPAKEGKTPRGRRYPIYAAEDIAAAFEKKKQGGKRK